MCNKKPKLGVCENLALFLFNPEVKCQQSILKQNPDSINSVSKVMILIQLLLCLEPAVNQFNIAVLEQSLLQNTCVEIQ